MRICVRRGARGDGGAAAARTEEEEDVHDREHRAAWDSGHQHREVALPAAAVGFQILLPLLPNFPVWGRSGMADGAIGPLENIRDDLFLRVRDEA